MGYLRPTLPTLVHVFLVIQFIMFSAPHAAPALVGEGLSLIYRPSVALLDTPIAVKPVVREVAGPSANPSFTLRATAYNSMVEQTNDQPFITATGARTRWGIIAVSRDMLGVNLPYGSLVRLTDLGTFAHGRGAGAYQALLDNHIFIVEDTMHPRKTQQIDVWFAEYSQAVAWGVRRLRVDVVRYGRNGPVFDHQSQHDPFEAPITFFAAN
jgi:3D (Asp-Asp-Asp) domain-containing protein